MNRLTWAEFAEQYGETKEEHSGYFTPNSWWRDEVEDKEEEDAEDRRSINCCQFHYTLDCFGMGDI